jgi:hypothetical protein
MRPVSSQNADPIAGNPGRSRRGIGRTQSQAITFLSFGTVTAVQKANQWDDLRKWRQKKKTNDTKPKVHENGGNLSPSIPDPYPSFLRHKRRIGHNF